MKITSVPKTNPIFENKQSIRSHLKKIRRVIEPQPISEHSLKKISQLAPINAYYTFMKSKHMRTWIKHVVQTYPQFEHSGYLLESISETSDHPNHLNLIDVMKKLISIAPKHDFEDAKYVGQFILTHTIINVEPIKEMLNQEERQRFNKYNREFNTKMKVIRKINNNLKQLAKYRNDDKYIARMAIPIEDITDAMRDTIRDITPKEMANQIKEYDTPTNATPNQATIMLRMRQDMPMLLHTGLWLIEVVYSHTSEYDYIEIENGDSMYLELLQENISELEKTFNLIIGSDPEKQLGACDKDEFPLPINKHQTILTLKNGYLDGSFDNTIKYPTKNDNDRIYDILNTTAIDSIIALLSTRGFDPMLTFDTPIKQEFATNAQVVIRNVDTAIKSIASHHNLPVDPTQYARYERLMFIILIIIQILADEHDTVQDSNTEMKEQNSKIHADIDDLNAKIETLKQNHESTIRTIEKQTDHWRTMYEKASKDLTRFDATIQKLSTANETIETQDAYISEIEEQNEFLQSQIQAMQHESAYNTHNDLQQIIDESDFTHIIQKLNHKNVIIIGGHESWVLKMRNILPNAFIHTTDILNRDISRVQSAEYIIINTSMMNHPMYHRIKNEVNKRKTPLPNPIKYINATSSNVNRTLQLIDDIL